MFLDFFYLLRKHGVTTSPREYLDLMEGLARGASRPSIDEFYYLARTSLVKREQELDRFDQVFGYYFRNKLGESHDLPDEIPENWLRQFLERELSPEARAAIEASGGLEALMEKFREIWESQKERHEGGDTFVGTLGTSPFGAQGYNPQGIRMGQREGRHGKGQKVWDRRDYANLDDRLELDTRGMKLALRRLRLLTREGRADELDLPGTVRRTSHNGGSLDLKWVPSRRNNVKVLLLLDAGGSMDPFSKLCSRLFSAARYEFKHLRFFYFHNCLYEHLWEDNRRRFSQKKSTWEVLRTYSSDYRVIWVGDAAMSPIELTHAGGSVEHWNEEPGLLWMQRMRDHFPHMVWLNPSPERFWSHYESTRLLREFMSDRMFPLTLNGLERAMRSLRRKSA